MLSCDTFALGAKYTDNGKNMFAKNSDRPLGEAQGLRFYPAADHDENEELQCTSLKIPKADALYELKGEFVNLEYTLPSGKAAKLLNDNAVYLGTQIEFADLGICYGVVADPGFILVCSYSVDGSEPELVCYKKR